MNNWPMKNAFFWEQCSVKTVRVSIHKEAMVHKIVATQLPFHSAKIKLSIAIHNSSFNFCVIFRVFQNGVIIYFYTPMKLYFKENRKGISSCDRSPHGKLFAISLSPGELKSSPHHNINLLYTLFVGWYNIHIYATWFGKTTLGEFLRKLSY